MERDERGRQLRNQVEDRTLGPAGESLRQAAGKAAERVKDAPGKAGERLKSAAEERGLTTEGLSLPRTQIRAYRWCSPPRIGRAIMSPNHSIGRVQGASFASDR